MQELFGEINSRVRKIGSMEVNNELKTSVLRELKSLHQDIETFDVPLGHKTVIKAIRNFIRSQPEKQGLVEHRSNKNSEDVLRNLVSKRILQLPANQREKVEEVKLSQKEGSSDIWMICCPLCSEMIEVKYKNNKHIVKNFYKHLKTKHDSGTPEKSLTTDSSPLNDSSIDSNPSPPLKRFAAQDNDLPGPSSIATKQQKLRTKSGRSRKQKKVS